MKKKSFKTRGNRYSKAERRKILSERRTGKTLEQLKKKFGVSAPTIHRWLNP